MKLRLKKIVLGICLALALVVNSGGAITANAVSCLDVRDYGCHRYAERHYAYYDGVKEIYAGRIPIVVQGTIVNYAKRYYICDAYHYIDFCMCGLAREYYIYVPFDMVDRIE